LSSVFAAVFVLASAAFLCESCGQAVEQENEPIRIAVSTWPGWFHVFLAREKGFFERNGVDVELIHIQEYIDAQQTFLNGQADGVFQCLADTIIQNSELSSNVVYVSDYSSTGDVIVGDLDSLSSAKGKTVAVEGVNTFSHMFVLNALENAGLQEHDVQFEVIPAHQLLEALEKGRVAAGHTWEPTKSDAIEKGYKILATAGDSLGTISNLLVFRSETIERRPEDILAIVKSLIEAQGYRDTHWDESIRIMADAVGMSYEAMESGQRGSNQLDLQANRDAMRQSDDPVSLHVSGKYIADFYLARGQLPSRPVLDEIIDGRFLSRLARDRE